MKHRPPAQVTDDDARLFREAIGDVPDPDLNDNLD